MIERYTFEDVERITNVPVEVATRVSETDMAVLGQIPLYPLIFEYVNGVLEGDTTYTKEYYQLLGLARTLNRGREPGSRFNVRDPRTLIESAKMLQNVPSHMRELVSTHDAKRLEKEAIVRSLRSEAYTGSSFREGEVEEIDYSPDLIPLYAIESQLVVVGLQNVRAMRDRATGGAVLSYRPESELIVITDTSESTGASHQAFSEGDAEKFTGGYNAIDERHIPGIDPDEVVDLRNFSNTTERIVNLHQFLPQLITLHGWRE